jgi:hypothetical protein
LRRRHPSELVNQRADFGIVEHVLGKDKLARLDPCNIGH